MHNFSGSLGDGFVKAKQMIKTNNFDEFLKIISNPQFNFRIDNYALYREAAQPHIKPEFIIELLKKDSRIDLSTSGCSILEKLSSTNETELFKKILKDKNVKNKITKENQYNSTLSKCLRVAMEYDKFKIYFAIINLWYFESYNLIPALKKKVRENSYETVKHYILPLKKIYRLDLSECRCSVFYNADEETRLLLFSFSTINRYLKEHDFSIWEQFNQLEMQKKISGF